MAALNKCSFIGNLGADPDVKYTAEGMAIATISIGVTEKWKSKSGEKQERTEWVRVKFFGKLAEIAGEYLKKGSQVYVEGKLRTEKYTDKSGVEKYSTDIIADEMQMLGGKQEKGESQPAAGQRNAPSSPSSDDPFPEDSIPF